MPRKTTVEAERRVEGAAQDFREGKYRSIRAAAAAHAVSYSTLHGRLNGAQPKTAKIPTNKALNKVQEDVLLRWIRFLDNHGFSPTKRMVVAFANEIRQRDDSAAKLLSRKWAARWLKAQRQRNGLFTRKRKSMEAARQAAFDRSSVEAWFGQLCEVILENGIQPDDILNFDETGYRIGVAGDQEVVTFYPSRRSTLPNETNREHITVAETVSAGGWVIPPVIIIAGVDHLERYY